MIEYNSFRWQEIERYDPMKDARVVRFMAITDKGSFHAERPVSNRRETRKAFREHALSLIEQGAEPCEVNIEQG